MKINKEIVIDDLTIINKWLEEFKEKELPKLPIKYGGWATRVDIDSNGDIIKISTNIASQILRPNLNKPERTYETIGKLDEIKFQAYKAMLTLKSYFSEK